MGVARSVPLVLGIGYDNLRRKRNIRTEPSQNHKIRQVHAEDIFPELFKLFVRRERHPLNDTLASLKKTTTSMRMPNHF